MTYVGQQARMEQVGQKDRSESGSWKPNGHQNPYRIVHNFAGNILTGASS